MLRFAVIASYSLWIGGLTFYALFVVPEGKEVFGSHTAQGFVTQRVTNSLNDIGLLSLAVFAFNWFSNRSIPQRSRLTLPSWIGMALCQLLLLPMHTSLDALLNKDERYVIDGPEFYAVHRIYLLLSGLMWLCSIMHLVGVMHDWKQQNVTGIAQQSPVTKGWRRWLLILSGSVVGLLFIGLLLPVHGRVQRSVTMQVPREAIYSEVVDLRRWASWTAWNTKRFHDMKTVFTGSDIGIGAKMNATGRSSGNGVVTILKADKSKGVEYELDLENGTQLFRGVIEFLPNADAVTVTWTLDADLGANPIKRWAGLLLMDRLMGGDMQTGLMNLKQRLEPNK